VSEARKETPVEKPFPQRLREEFDIPTPIAVWVVITHIFVLASPLALIWAIHSFGHRLPLANPVLVQFASAVYIAATAFETAQNSADRWYLTEVTRSVADLCFNSLITVAACMYTIGFYGNGWMSAVAVALTVAYPIAYIQNHPAHRGISGVVVGLATVSLFLVTGDPVAFLYLVGTLFGVYLIVLLLDYRSQWLHGWAAFTFGLGFLAYPWAVVNAARGSPASWALVAGVTAAVILTAASLNLILPKLKVTPRVYS
jgi:hypothetical protein